MHCEQARDLIYNRKARSFEPHDSPAFEGHLESCDNCRQLYQTVVNLEREADCYIDEAVPRWNRSTVGVDPASKSPLFWVTWVPLAACFLLAMLVIFQAQVISNENGFSLSFGASPAESTVDNSVIQAYVDQAVSRIQQENKQQISGLLSSYRQEQQTYFDDLMVQLTSNNRIERQGDMKTLVSRWQEQRVDDLLLIEQKFDTIYLRQKQNTNQLYNISNYVSRAPQKKNM